MIIYKEIFRKMPIPLFIVKYELIENNKQPRINIEFINNEGISFLNKTYDELVNKDFFEVLPDFKDDKSFIHKINNMGNDNINYTKYIRNLMNFINVTVQKIQDDYFIFYLESCIEKKIFDEINEVGNIFFIKSKDNKYMYSSDLYNKYAGHSNIDIYGMTDIELYGEKDGNNYKRATKEFIDSKKAYNKEICRLNNTMYLLNRYAIYSKGQVIGIIGVFESIVGKLEKIYDGSTISKIVNNSPDHLAFKDITGVYRDYNYSFLRDLNIKCEEIIGKTDTNIGKLSETHDNIIKSDLEVIKHKRESERLQQEFFANISHELRTPLNLIFSSLQMMRLMENNILENKSKVHKYIDIIDQNSKRLLKLVNNLIDTTRMKCGYYKYNPKNENIVSFIENISMAVAEFAKQNNIELIFDTDVEEKIMAFDLEKLERIILNLLSNSIKYNKANGKIEVLLNECDDSFNITVKDTGVGIPDNKLEYIFDRFKQVENRFRKSSEGSGIGLSIVKDLIEIHGGSIKVKSELGIGSEFTINLPVKILSNECNLNKKYFNSGYHALLERMDIEFSDIYI